MPKTITTVVYEFDELSDAAKENARDWYREGMDNNDYADAVIEDAVRMGEMLGITIDTHEVPLMNGKTRPEPTVYWALHVQGAGASFAGRYEYRKGSTKDIAHEAPPDGGDNNAHLNDIARGLAEVQKAHGYLVNARITHGREVHEQGPRIEVYINDDEADDDTRAEVSGLLREFMRWIYKGLEAEYEYQTSDEQVDESIRANEYTFTEEGKRRG